MAGYASSLHHHLLYDSRSRNQWRCDGFREVDGCLSGRNGIFGTEIPRYRCRCCSFDICGRCINHYGNRPTETFSTGQIVEFLGLKIRTTLNGLCGVIMNGTFTPSSYRVKVSTTGEETIVSGRFLTSTLSALKPPNSPLSAPPKPATSVPQNSSLPASPKPSNLPPTSSEQPVPTASSTPTYATPCCGNCSRELKLTPTSPGIYTEGYRCDECGRSHQAPYERWFC